MPNVVLLISDEHNPRFTSVYGHSLVQTPNMAHLAENGCVYENAYCPSPLCLPSRSAFMSGRRVHEIQTYSNCNVNLRPDWPSYGRVLAEKGVHTVHIGKTHAYAPAGSLGFSEMILPGDVAPPGDPNVGRRPLKIRAGSRARADGWGPCADAVEEDLCRIDAAIRWLTDTAPQLDGPWTLSVNTGKPHFPHTVPQDLWDMYADAEIAPAAGPECESANHPCARDLRDYFETDYFTAEQSVGLIRGYLGCVRFVDRQLGRLLDTIEQTGLGNCTDVIYTSDHGEMLGKFGMWWKCSLYEDSVRVPLIAMGPSFPRSLRVRTPTDLMDVQATLFQCTGAARPVDWIGQPLTQIEAADDSRLVFSEYHGHGARASAYMIRRGKWKYLHYVEAPNQLFDLDSDPDELRNVCDRHPDVAAELEVELRRVCSPEKENDRAEQFIAAQLSAIDGESV